MGAGELGKELIWLIEDINKKEPTWVILGFLDDTKAAGDIYCGYPILGSMDQLETIREKDSFYAVIAVQNGSDKASIADKHKEFNRWATIIHPTAAVAPQSKIGVGSIIFPQVTVSVDTVIGKHSLLYIHAIVCNDCVFGDHVSIMSGVSIAEHVIIGDRTYVSAGCDVYPHITIGKDCNIVVGSTVEDNLEDGSIKGKKNKGLFIK